MRAHAIVSLLAFLLAACASGEPPNSTSSVVGAAGSMPTSTTTVLDSATTTVAGPSGSEAPTSTTVPEIDVEFVDGEVTGPGIVELEVGEKVDVWILSDVDDDIHVHGYDLTHELEAGVPLHLSFVADVPGIFEIEVHTGNTVLFELEVSG